jgi:hypothetical protein
MPIPKISLVVCAFREGNLLARLFRAAQGVYDDLVVVHDGPDTQGVRAVVEAAGGRFFERPRAYQQEPHWPFAWECAAHDWILRLDADEFPSKEMKAWLQNFRTGPEPAEAVSGFTCIWPLWNGRRVVTQRSPAGRIFLFHRQRVRFFGMVEQMPVADGRYDPLDFVLHHRPERKTYGLRNLLVRKQAYRWRAHIAYALLDEPEKLVCWRWENRPWPQVWQDIRQHPFRTAFRRLTRGTLAGLRDQWRLEKHLFPAAAISGPVHHALIALEYWRLRRLRARGRRAEAHQWVFHD